MLACRFTIMSCASVPAAAAASFCAAAVTIEDMRGCRGSSSDYSCLPSSRVVLRFPAPAAGSTLALRQLGLCPDADDVVVVIIIGSTGDVVPPRDHLFVQNERQATVAAAESSVDVVVEQNGCVVSGFVSRLVKKLVLGVLTHNAAVLDAFCDSRSGIIRRWSDSTVDRDRLQHFAQRCRGVIACALREVTCRCPICLAPLGRSLPSGRLLPCEGAACVSDFEQSCRGSYYWDDEGEACATTAAMVAFEALPFAFLGAHMCFPPPRVRAPAAVAFEPLLRGGKSTSGIAAELLFAWAASKAAVADPSRLRSSSSSSQSYALSGSRGNYLQTAAIAFCPADYSVPAATARAVVLPCDVRPAQEALARMHLALASLPASLLVAGAGGSSQNVSPLEQPQASDELGPALRHALAPQRCELLEVPLRARLPISALLQLAVVAHQPAVVAHQPVKRQKPADKQLAARGAAAPVLAFHGSPLCNWCGAQAWLI